MVTIHRTNRAIAIQIRSLRPVLIDRLAPVPPTRCTGRGTILTGYPTAEAIQRGTICPDVPESHIAGLRQNLTSRGHEDSHNSQTAWNQGIHPGYTFPRGQFRDTRNSLKQAPSRIVTTCPMVRSRWLKNAEKRMKCAERGDPLVAYRATSHYVRGSKVSCKD